MHGVVPIVPFHLPSFLSLFPCSLEDRLVKRAFARACGRATPEDDAALAGPNKFAYLDELAERAVAVQVSRKPIVADDEECLMNPRSRSAKLRIIQRKGAQQ
jgi:16S rRNA (cytosine1402-N4)-methyltransferase